MYPFLDVALMASNYLNLRKRASKGDPDYMNANKEFENTAKITRVESA